MAAAEGGMFSRRMVDVRAQVHHQLGLHQSAEAAEELNVLLKHGLKKAEYKKEEDWFAEDGFAPDESDPLEFVTDEGNLPPAVAYQVVHKRIAIRKSPSLEGKVLGTAVEGDTLNTYDWDASRQWRKIHFRLRGGWGSTVVAWVMVKHSTLGFLCKSTNEMEAEQQEQEAGPAPTPAAGGEQPSQPQVEASAENAASKSASAALPLTAEELEDAARQLEQLMEEFGRSKGKKKEKKELSELEILKGAKPSESEDEDEGEDGTQEFPKASPEGYVYATVEELDEGADSGGLQYQVVHKPFIAVRSLAAPKGKVLRNLEYGVYVDTFSWDAKKKWRKIFCRQPDDRIIVAWVMTSHPELGPLLEPAAG